MVVEIKCSHCSKHVDASTLLGSSCKTECPVPEPLPERDTLVCNTLTGIQVVWKAAIAAIDKAFFRTNATGLCRDNNDRILPSGRVQQWRFTAMVWCFVGTAFRSLGDVLAKQLAVPDGIRIVQEPIKHLAGDHLLHVLPLALREVQAHHETYLVQPVCFLVAKELVPREHDQKEPQEGGSHSFDHLVSFTLVHGKKLRSYVVLLTQEIREMLTTACGVFAGRGVILAENG